MQSLFDSQFNQPVDKNDTFVDIQSADVFKDFDFHNSDTICITFKLKNKDNIIVWNELQAIINAKFKSLEVQEINEIHFKNKYNELVRQIQNIINN